MICSSLLIVILLMTSPASIPARAAPLFLTTLPISEVFVCTSTKE